jgi:hypothetical protein
MRAILTATDITPTEEVTKSTSPRNRMAEECQSELPLNVEMETTALANTILGPVQDTAAWISGSGSKSIFAELQQRSALDGPGLVPPEALVTREQVLWISKSEFGRV